MRYAAAIVLALAGVGLAGCFISTDPLISAGEAAFPYHKIVYTEQGSTKQMTMIHEGSFYQVQETSSDTKGQIRLLKAADDLYVVQLDVRDKSKVEYLYALLKVDLSAKTVASYKAMAENADAEPGPGLRRCDDHDTEQVCIDRLDAYVDYARKAIAAGAKPQAVYTIVSVE